MPLAKQSDAIRCALLSKHGGIWMDKKEQAVACYKSRMHGKDNFWERTKSLNYFYGFLANYKARYAEALHIESVTEYLQRADDRDWARYM